MEREKVISNYINYDEDKRVFGTKAEQIEFIYTKKLLYQYVKPSMSVGDATNLPEIGDNSFDVVLTFGPMYHLPQYERQMAILESKRICKDGGTILFAYINKIGAYLRACLDENLKTHYPNKQANECVLTAGVDNILSDVFFYTMPELRFC